MGAAKDTALQRQVWSLVGGNPRTRSRKLSVQVRRRRTPLAGRSQQRDEGFRQSRRVEFTSSHRMRKSFEIVLKDQKSSQTMDTAPTSALPTNSAGDVPIDGLSTGGRRIVQTKTASAGLRLVCQLPKANSALKVDSRTRSRCCDRDDISNAFRGSSSPYWAGSRQRRWKVNRERVYPGHFFEPI